MSVQASWGHYSSPKSNIGPYHEVEVGFPSEHVEELIPYMDGPSEDPTDEVYGYVPVNIVVGIIEKHGGQVGDQIPFLVWAFRKEAEVS
tara:strand:- start:326 stop:592 length:267 start_codon:yes stop_codon:yes gene_type:complete